MKEKASLHLGPYIEGTEKTHQDSMYPHMLQSVKDLRDALMNGLQIGAFSGARMLKPKQLLEECTTKDQKDKAKLAIYGNYEKGHPLYVFEDDELENPTESLGKVNDLGVCRMKLEQYLKQWFEAKE